MISSLQGCNICIRIIIRARISPLLPHLLGQIEYLFHRGQCSVCSLEWGGRYGFSLSVLSPLSLFCHSLSLRGGMPD